MMLSMNTEHPAFDLDMEILCTLPSSTTAHRRGTVRVANEVDLMEDFGFDSMADLRAAIKRLCKRFPILRSIGVDGHRGYRIASASQGDITEAIVACNTYWKSVYAADLANA